MAGARERPLQRKVWTMRKRSKYCPVCAAVLAVGLSALPAICPAQQPALPDAPSAHPAVILAQAFATPAQQPATSPQMPAATQGATPTGPTLTIAQAEQMAIRNNPNISVARLLALAQAQVTREVRSVEMPIAMGDLTAVDAHDNSRITAGVSRTTLHL